MASGDMLFSFTAPEAVDPSTNPATLDYTAAFFPLLDYDDATSESAYFFGFLPPSYDGTSGITVTLAWKFTTYVGSQTCDWEVSFFRVADDADTIESFTFATAQTVLATEAGTAGELDYATIAFTNAQADGAQGGEMFVLRVTRDASGGTASPGDAELAGVLGEVT